ncbi:MAG: hypothetical protein DVB25_08340 [Verrucomicrobia bacterium]|nr:MAG: hypothetical protein DVB25_08340 [Verrucomicrobiota bacterium]
MYTDEGEAEELKCCYSVGSFGPFPITFYRLNGKVFYHPQEFDECGPFASLKKALEDAASEFGSSSGGFYENLKDARNHAEWMRKQGFSVE